ncbi:MAG: hypothetical protein EA393_03080 [Bacteroidetes bacterium]|nr:MAG: hypothetical protein EA393_03080 [Bacteroidota bacterium]
MRIPKKSIINTGFKMQNSFLPVIAGLLLAVASCSPTGLSMLTRQSYHVDDKSWQEDTLKGYVFIPNSRVLVRTRHDEDSIFIEVRTRDSLSMRSMLTNGLSIWIDPQAKQNENYGVNIPAARAEMMRRQEETFQRIREEGDTLQRFSFDYASWTKSVSEKRFVITDKRGTRFDESDQVQILYTAEGGLVYTVRFGFSQAGIDKEKAEKFSVGVVSERHQAQMPATGQSQMRGPTDRYGRARQQPPTREQRPERLGLISVKGWIVFTLTDDKPAS